MFDQAAEAAVAAGARHDLEAPGAQETRAQHLAETEGEREAENASASRVVGTARTSGRRGGGFLAPLRLASFRRLIAGQTISRLGDQFYFLAIPWLVLRVTDSPVALSLVLGISALTLGLCTVLGGVLADRMGPRNLMMSADIARMLIMGALAGLAIFVAVPPLWAITALSGLLGIASGLFYPASSAMVPHLVSTEDLQAANSYEQLTFQTSNFVGPGVAGIVLSATRLAFGFVVDAASFVVSVLTLALIRMPRRAPAQGATDAMQASNAPKAGSLGEALRYLWRTRFLVMLIGVSLIANFAINGLFEVGVPLLLKERVGLIAGPQVQGIVVGGFGLGSVLGAVAAGLAVRVRRKTLVGVLLFVPFTLLAAVIPLAPSIFLMAGIFAVMGLLTTASNVLLATVIQRFIPLDMMGRMMSFVLMGSFLGTPLSIFAYGAAATVVPSVDWLFFGGAALMALALALALGNKLTWQTK
jgi:MFS family permease